MDTTTSVNLQAGNAGVTQFSHVNRESRMVWNLSSTQSMSAQNFPQDQGGYTHRQVEAIRELYSVVKLQVDEYLWRQYNPKLDHPGDLGGK